jgi:hemerythrin-like metal-binding protein
VLAREEYAVDANVMVWTKSLAIGSPGIDAQHRRLIELIAAIPDRPSRGDEAILVEALRYAATHFAAEEAHMASIGYPGLPAHRNAHRRLTTILGDYKRRFDGGDTDLYSFKQFMFNWVRDHIMDEDRKIGIYLGRIQDVDETANR